MERIDALRATLPEHARDLRLNLPAVLGNERLTPAQRWGTAIACAAFRSRGALLAALRADAAAAGVPAETVEDALAAAAIMGMNTVYYRARHLLRKDSYQQMPARLRMQRIASPASTKLDFELFCLACGALAGCETCLRSHEQEVLGRGLTEEHVLDAVRIAAVVEGVGVALAAGSSRVLTPSAPAEAPTPGDAG